MDGEVRGKPEHWNYGTLSVRWFSQHTQWKTRVKEHVQHQGGQEDKVRIITAILAKYRQKILCSERWIVGLINECMV